MKASRCATYLCAALSLCGCTPLMQASWDTLRSASVGPASLELSEADVIKLNYYQIKLQIQGRETVMVLVRQQGDLQYWLSPTAQVVMMRDGLAVRTVGLPDDLVFTDLGAGSPFKSGLNNLPDGYTSVRQIDLLNNYGFGIPLNSRFHPGSIETVRILQRSYRLKRVDEHIQIPLLGFNATNQYWIDPSDGFIMKSIQNITPEVQVTITQLRPYRKKTAN